MRAAYVVGLSDGNRGSRTNGHGGERVGARVPPLRAIARVNIADSVFERQVAAGSLEVLDRSLQSR
jgi:hypothetical protein